MPKPVDQDPATIRLDKVLDEMGDRRFTLGAMDLQMNTVAARFETKFAEMGDNLNRLDKAVDKALTRMESKMEDKMEKALAIGATHSRASPDR